MATVEHEADLGQLSGMVRRREDVGQQDKLVLKLVARRPRHFQAVEVRIRHADILGLPALIRSEAGIAVACADTFRVRDEAGIGISPAAVEAVAAADVERQDDPVSGLDLSDGIADAFNYAHDLVADGAADFKRRAPVVHMQVRAADSRRRDL